MYRNCPVRGYSKGKRNLKDDAKPTDLGRETHPIPTHCIALQAFQSAIFQSGPPIAKEKTKDNNPVTSPPAPITPYPSKGLKLRRSSFHHIYTGALISVLLPRTSTAIKLLNLTLSSFGPP